MTLGRYGTCSYSVLRVVVRLATLLFRSAARFGVGGPAGAHWLPVDGFAGELELLRAENARLRNLLRLTEEQSCAPAGDQTAAAVAPVDMGSSPQDKVRFYLDLFACRSDTYALRWEDSRDGRSGWSPAIRGRWRKGMATSEASYLPLTGDVVDRHLRGAHHIGLYPLSDEDTCWWIAADFDARQLCWSIGRVQEFLDRLVEYLGLFEHRQVAGFGDDFHILHAGRGGGERS